MEFFPPNQQPRLLSRPAAMALAGCLGLLTGCDIVLPYSHDASAPPSTQTPGPSPSQGGPPVGVGPGSVTTLVVPAGSSGARHGTSTMTLESILGEPMEIREGTSPDGKIVIRHGFFPSVPTISVPTNSG
jgi:hypothetical protein